MRLKLPIHIAGLTLSFVSLAQSALVYSENFDGATLIPEVDEASGIGGNVWNTPEDSGLGWSRGADVLPVPGRITEWAGWSFATTEFWITAAGDQDRSSAFASSSMNVVAIADSDEYDDTPDATVDDEYNVFLRTPEIDVSGYDLSTLQLSFDSSFRLEENETSAFSVSFDGLETATIDVLDSGTSPAVTLTFDAVALNAPATANTMVIEFAHEDADNNWWWAIDNVEINADVIPEPSTTLLLGLAALGLFRRRR